MKHHKAMSPDGWGVGLRGEVLLGERETQNLFASLSTEQALHRAWLELPSCPERTNNADFSLYPGFQVTLIVCKTCSFFVTCQDLFSLGVKHKHLLRDVVLGLPGPLLGGKDVQHNSCFDMKFRGAATQLSPLKEEKKKITHSHVQILVFSLFKSRILDNIFEEDIYTSEPPFKNFSFIHSFMDSFIHGFM